MHAKLRKMLKQESCGFPWRARNNFYELFKSSVSHMNVWMRSWPVSPHVQDCQFKCLFLRCRPQNVVHWTSWWKLYWETIAGIHRNAGAIKLAPAVKNRKTSLAAAFQWCKSFSKCSRSPRSSMSDHLLGCINRLSSKRCSHKLSDISVFPGLPSGVSCVRDNGSSKTAGHYMTDCLCHNLHVVWDHHLKELFLLLASVANTQVATKVDFPPLRKETTKWKIKRLPVLESLLIFFCRLDTNEFYLHLFVFDSFQMLFSSKDKSFGFILNILLCGQPQQFSWLYVSILWYFVHYSNLQSEKKEFGVTNWPLTSPCRSVGGHQPMLVWASTGACGLRRSLLEGLRAQWLDAMVHVLSDLLQQECGGEANADTFHPGIQCWWRWDDMTWENATCVQPIKLSCFTAWHFPL